MSATSALLVGAYFDNFCYYPPPPTESGRLPEMTGKVPGGIGRVPPPNKNPGYAVG